MDDLETSTHLANDSPIGLRPIREARGSDGEDDFANGLLELGDHDGLDRFAESGLFGTWQDASDDESMVGAGDDAEALQEELAAYRKTQDRDLHHNLR